MFCGITQGLFPVVALIKHEGLFQYTVSLNETLVKNLKVGASVAIDGVCQTVIAINGVEVIFEAIKETLNKTTLNYLSINRMVSVERSLKFGDEIGGHEISGHVFEKGKIVSRKESNNNLSLTIKCSEECFAFITTKGFVAIDGSSLTVGALNQLQKSFEVNLIPETLRLTNFSNQKVGSYVNLEPDMKTMILLKGLKNYFFLIEAKLENLEKELITLKKNPSVK